MMDPRRFFEVALPKMVSDSLGEFIEVQGRISFHIRPGGQWTFHFGNPEPVQRGLAPDAELKLTFQRRAFNAFLDGTLDAEKALQRREVTAEGTAFELLETFGRILRTPATDLGWSFKEKPSKPAVP